MQLRVKLEQAHAARLLLNAQLHHAQIATVLKTLMIYYAMCESPNLVYYFTLQLMHMCTSYCIAHLMYVAFIFFQSITASHICVSLHMQDVMMYYDLDRTTFSGFYRFLNNSSHSSSEV